jgi:hypothetical protein
MLGSIAPSIEANRGRVGGRYVDEAAASAATTPLPGHPSGSVAARSEPHIAPTGTGAQSGITPERPGGQPYGTVKAAPPPAPFSQFTTPLPGER